MLSSTRYTFHNFISRVSDKYLVKKLIISNYYNPYIENYKRVQSFSNSKNLKKPKLNMERWIKCGKYNLLVWSISGVETCVVVNAEDLQIVFDLGYAVRESVDCKYVFISHGHMDHVSGVAHHAAKRSLYGMAKAVYHVPGHLKDSLHSVSQGFNVMAEKMDVLGKLNIMAIDGDQKVHLPQNYFVRPFPTIHTAKSQGYIVYKETKKLKQQYVGTLGVELAKLYKQGVPIHDISQQPEIAYTGDTRFDVFLNPPTSDLLRVKVLIVEATYIDDEPGTDMVAKARERGHIHLSEILENSHLFENIQQLVLMHFSDKYSVDYIHKYVYSSLPPSLRNKVILATLAKQVS